MSERKDQVNTACGIAETIGGTPYGEHFGEFTWRGTDQRVGTRQASLPSSATEEK